MRNQNNASPAVVASLNAANERAAARQAKRDAANALPFEQVETAEEEWVEDGILELAD